MTLPHRVLHLLPDLERGGGQGVTLQLVTHADRSRFEVFVARLRPPDDLDDAFERAGAPPIRLEQSAGGPLALAFELARHLRHLHIDVVHVHSGPDRKVGQLAALLTRTPVVGHLHSPWAHLRPMHGETAGALIRTWSGGKARLRRAVEAQTVRHYVAAGGEVAAFHLGLVAAPIATADNGIDVARFSPPTAATRRQARAELGVSDDVPLLVCVGRLAAGKGQAELITLLADLPSSQLLLVGDGAERAALKRLAASVGVADRVLFVGARDDVAALLAAADLFVLASVSEGLPLAVLEAMASELPVVAYALPGLRGVITEGIDGRLVPLGERGLLTDAIAGVLDDDQRRARMAAAARATVTTRFDARLMVRRTEAVYDTVLGIDPLSARRSDAHRLVAR